MRPVMLSRTAMSMRVAIDGQVYEYTATHPDTIKEASRYFKHTPWLAVNTLKRECTCIKQEPEQKPVRKKPGVLRIVDGIEIGNADPMRMAYELLCQGKRFYIHWNKMFTYEMEN